MVNGTEYCSLVGMKYPPPSSLAMYLRRFYELDFPLVLRQSIGFASKQRLYKHQDFNTPIALALSTVDPKNLKYVEEVREFRSRIENEKELPVWWHFSVLVRAKDRETLRTRRAQVIRLLKEIGSFGIAEKRNLKAAFFSLLPGHDRFYLRRALIATANAGDLLSAYVLYQGDTEPVDYLQDRLHGVFAYNPFHEPGKSPSPRHLRAHGWREELLRHQRPALTPDRQPDDLGGGPVQLLWRSIRTLARGDAGPDRHHEGLPP